MEKAKWVMLVFGGGAVLLAVLLTGCLLPGHHGGHHGLPRPPGLPGHHGGLRESPSQDSGAATSESPDGIKSPQLVQNRNTPMPQGERHE